MKLSIYYGKESPLTAIGKNQCHLLEFAYNYPTWHSASSDVKTQKAITGLVKRGSIILNEFGQFKINT